MHFSIVSNIFLSAKYIDPNNEMISATKKKESVLYYSMYGSGADPSCLWGKYYGSDCDAEEPAAVLHGPV